MAEIATYETKENVAAEGTSQAMRIAWCYDRLDNIEADKAPTFAIMLLQGLGKNLIYLCNYLL